MAVDLEGACYIALSANLSENEEIESLSHEIGHCAFAGFYSRLTPLNTKGRIEYRAKKWQYWHLVPPGDLRQALKSGITEVWELAEHFAVSEPFVKDAIEYYNDACGLLRIQD